MSIKCANPTCDKPAKLFSSFCEDHPIGEVRDVRGYRDSDKIYVRLDKSRSGGNPGGGSGGIL